MDPTINAVKLDEERGKIYICKISAVLPKKCQLSDHLPGVIPDAQHSVVPCQKQRQASPGGPFCCPCFSFRKRKCSHLRMRHVKTSSVCPVGQRDGTGYIWAYLPQAKEWPGLCFAPFAQHDILFQISEPPFVGPDPVLARMSKWKGPKIMLYTWQG